MRIAYVVNNAAFFASHRLPIALEARRRGCQVVLICGQAGSEVLEAPALERLTQTGVPVRRVAFHSGGMNPWLECFGFCQLVAELRTFRPDVVHCVSAKGVLYGGIAARLAQRPAMVFAVSGMGSIFTGAARGRKAAVRRVYQWLAQIAYKHCNKRVIVQNADDARAIEASRLASAEELVLISGSGVVLEDYIGLEPSAKKALVVLPARMLKDKGVCEFMEAARRLRLGGCQWRFALVGTADYRNPTAVPLDDIQKWVDAGIVEWWGHVDDMPAVYEEASIVCLPSYREGMPKALLEAAAAGCAVVTTDAIGCRDAIVPGETGDLVAPGDAAELAVTLGALIEDPVRTERYGRAGRQRAIAEFGIQSVVDKTLDIYRSLRHPPG